MPTQAIAMGGLLLFGLALLGASGYVAAVGLDRVRTARALREAGPTPIADVADADGPVEFVGTARTDPSDGADNSLEAPLSSEPCLAYTVQSRVRDRPDEDATWNFDGQTSASVPFAVEDGPDRATVDPSEAVLSLDALATDESGWVDRADLSKAERDRLAATGLPGTDGDADQREPTFRQYREHRLGPGDEVRIFGGRVVDSSPSVGGGDWFEISVGERSSVFSDHRRSGSLYVIFGALVAVPGLGFTLAGIAGLASVFVL